MKASHITLFAAGVQAGGWSDWSAPASPEADVTVTQTVTSTHTTCPCTAAATASAAWNSWEAAGSGNAGPGNVVGAFSNVGVSLGGATVIIET